MVKCLISALLPGQNVIAKIMIYFLRYPEHLPCLSLVRKTDSPAPTCRCCYVRLVETLRQTEQCISLF